MIELTSVLVYGGLVGSGLMAGTFFAFSTFVMRGLAEVPASEGIRAMQRINVTVLNPWFLGVFMGTAGVGLACVAVGLWWMDGARSVALVGAGGFYVIGTFGVTVVCNVPMNEALARLEATTAEAEAYWQRYLRDWVFWNHVRTVAALVSLVLFGVFLGVGG
ncbi:DUF1772 domain-containing protein [Mucisphaera sp.]|uniref:anthrone oxygenase family protein n=1 Tax=Mucisphaera sp. TaxID=2913024 RepID=UPI003D0BC2B9